MEKLFEIIQASALIIFGIAFLFYWEKFADMIISQNVKQYSSHKGKIKILLYSIAVIFLFGGLKMLFFTH